nr:hypothetical protein [Tanacetum cinerariifolium]
MKANPQLQHDDLPIWLALKIKFEGLHDFYTPSKISAIRPRDQDDPYDDAHLKGENSTKRQKTSEHGTYMFGESSSGQVNESELGPEKIVLSLHKFPAVIIPDDDIEKRTSIWGKPMSSKMGLRLGRVSSVRSSSIKECCKVFMRSGHKLVGDDMGARCGRMGSVVGGSCSKSIDKDVPKRAAILYFDRLVDGDMDAHCGSTGRVVGGSSGRSM